MKCPKCGKEAIYNSMKVEIFKIEEFGSPWPVKILCQCETSYMCNDCHILITEAEMRDYMPN